MQLCAAAEWCCPMLMQQQALCSHQVIPLNVSNYLQAGHHPNNASWSTSPKSVHQQVRHEEWSIIVGAQGHLQTAKGCVQGTASF